MLKTKTTLEVMINDHLYEFTCSKHDAPLGEVYDALFQMVGFVIEKINQSQPKKAETEEPKEE